VGLVVLAHNGRAIRFYEKQGFVRDAPGYCVIPGVIMMNRPGRQ
jgi:ribosomal protein S18 acetylase RimI-like enzyme